MKIFAAKVIHVLWEVLDFYTQTSRLKLNFCLSSDSLKYKTLSPSLNLNL